MKPAPWKTLDFSAVLLPVNPLNLSEYDTVYLGHPVTHNDPYCLCADLIHFALEKGKTVLQRLRGSLRILNTIHQKVTRIGTILFQFTNPQNGIAYFG
jgi:hypothetical protein